MVLHKWTSGESNPGPTNLSLSIYERRPDWSTPAKVGEAAPPQHSHCYYLLQGRLTTPPSTSPVWVRKGPDHPCPAPAAYAAMASGRDWLRCGNRRTPACAVAVVVFPLSKPAGLSLATSVPARRRNLSGPWCGLGLGLLLPLTRRSAVHPDRLSWVCQPTQLLTVMVPWGPLRTGDDSLSTAVPTGLGVKARSCAAPFNPSSVPPIIRTSAVWVPVPTSSSTAWSG